MLETTTATTAAMKEARGEASFASGGTANCWELAGLYEGRRVRCTSAKSFLNYVRSEGTHEIRVTGRKIGDHVGLFAEGPVADDGVRLSVSHTLTKDDFHRKLCGSEQGILMRLLGELKPEKCLPHLDGREMVRDCLIKGFVRL